MITCPNKNLQEWKDLVSQVGEARAGLLWVMVDGDTSKLEEVNFEFKSVNILQSDKAKQVFEKGKKANWNLDKILTELQVPKEQKQLILDLGITDREQIALELANQMSYTIEINTAKENKKYQAPIDTDAVYIEIVQPTQHYSNLTVPGGTNYTENEISTPLITPSIKGHASFSTDNGIGWFRSDEQVSSRSEDFEEFYEQEYFGHEYPPEMRVKQHRNYFGEEYGSKTRRILEIQSDLFQKGRDIKSPDEIIQELQKSGKLEIKCS